MWKKCHGACDAFDSSFGGIYSIASVVLWCSTDVPSVNTMDGPCAASVGGFVDENFLAGRRKRSFVVFSWASAESRGLMRDGRMRFKVWVHW
jgi:hypothetical protein